jgi:hypothetical protein
MGGSEISKICSTTSRSVDIPHCRSAVGGDLGIDFHHASIVERRSRRTVVEVRHGQLRTGSDARLERNDTLHRYPSHSAKCVDKQERAGSEPPVLASGHASVRKSGWVVNDTGEPRPRPDRGRRSRLLGLQAPPVEINETDDSPGRGYGSVRQICIRN